MAVITFRPRAYAKVLLHSLKSPQWPAIGVLVAYDEGQSEASSHEGRGGALASDSGAPESPGPVMVEDAWALLHSLPVSASVLELALLQVEQLCRQRSVRFVGWYAAQDPAAENEYLTTDPADPPHPTLRHHRTVRAASGLVASALLKLSRPNDLFLLLDPLGLKELIASDGASLALSSAAQAPHVPLGGVFDMFFLSSGGWKHFHSPPKLAPKVQQLEGAKQGGKGEEKSKQGGSNSSTGESSGAVEKSVLGPEGIALEAVLHFSAKPWELQHKISDFEDHLEDITRDWSNAGLLQ